MSTSIKRCDVTFSMRRKAVKPGDCSTAQSFPRRSSSGPDTFLNPEKLPNCKNTVNIRTLFPARVAHALTWRFVFCDTRVHGMSPRPLQLRNMLVRLGGNQTNNKVQLTQRLDGCRAGQCRRRRRHTRRPQRRPPGQSSVSMTP